MYEWQKHKCIQAWPRHMCNMYSDSGSLKNKDLNFLQSSSISKLMDVKLNILRETTNVQFLGPWSFIQSSSINKLECAKFNTIFS
jgi:hypothetical protein